MEIDWEKLIPKPRSAFLLVECAECGHRQVVFDNVKIEVKCQVCGSTIALPRGGKAKILGRVLEKLS
ncbi:MAG: 30S ribosomal protein S27e [Nitrososphaeria archaeon]|nr:30S ribosomal protein S27e [Aigarchaeota archaeon]MCX8187359.1 30S ribosomal protein S27e [Nitrososphaeria archaeon]